MSEGSRLDVVAAYQDAWVKRDFARARQFLAGDVTFRSPGQHLSGVDEFMAMISAFAQRIEPRWELIAATEEEDGVLLLYNLFTSTGISATCADWFTVREGRIQSETLTFDPKPFAAAPQSKTA